MKLLKNKKIIMSLLVLLALIGGFFWWRGRTTTPEETEQKQKLTLPNNVIPGAERPYLSIEPLADGRNVEITIHNLKKDAQEMEYELEYQAGTLLQGAFGTLDLASLPATAQMSRAAPCSPDIRAVVSPTRLNLTGSTLITVPEKPLTALKMPSSRLTAAISASNVISLFSTPQVTQREFQAK